ncbi:baculoviral IAP repeat-containing protein 7-like [Styela clava]
MSSNFDNEVLINSLESGFETRLFDIVDRDGVTNSGNRDAPGQSCVYILSGNHENEGYRIATFAKYPENIPVLPIHLARAGFYYTGFRDRVKCFSCGITVENWMIGDDPSLGSWHKTDCTMARGNNIRNVASDSVYPSLMRQILGPSSNSQRNNRHQEPSQSAQPCSLQGAESTYNDVTERLNHVSLGNQVADAVNVQFQFADIVDQEHGRMLRTLNLYKEEDRRKTYQKWPTYPAPYLSSTLAKNGLFYLGNLDRTQCYFCGGVLRNWAANDDVQLQHRSHFGNCKMFTSNHTGNIPLSEQERQNADAADRVRLQQVLLGDDDPIQEPPDLPAEDQRRMAALYPLNAPINPHMRTMQARLQSFDNWPERTRATKEQIAKAGFFYLGQSDKTKCFYCNGGLQNWDPNDEPWTEHAKWFPGCAFVIREKGQEFVRRQFELHPNLNRPTIRNSVSYDIPPDVPPTQTNINIESLQDMGFPTERIQRLMRRKTEIDRRGYTDVQELIEDLLAADLSSPVDQNTSSMQEAEEHHSAAVQGAPMIAVAAGAVAGHKRNGDNSSNEAKKIRTQSPVSASREMAENLRFMQESDRCRNCLMNPADVVSIPCGHLGACSDCARNMKRCFICKMKVQSQVKVFRA